MSRLCCSDPELFARYSEAKLQTDLCVKSDTSSQTSAGFPVSLHVVQTYSDRLADFVQVAVENGDSELVVERAPSKALKLFVQAMYGHGLKQTFCPVIDGQYNSDYDSEHDVRDLKDLVWFGHKYNVTQMESAVCEVITSHALRDADIEEVIDFYKHVPLECCAVHDAIFQIMLGFEKSYVFAMMEFAVIALRHVNEMLAQDRKHPKRMLETLQFFVEKQVRFCAVTAMPHRDLGFNQKNEALVQWETEFSWDFEVTVPIPSDLESLDFRHKDINEWLEFATDLKPGCFKNGIDNWISNMLMLMYKHVLKERNAYKQHIQAQFPNKRIKIEAGQLLFH